MDIISERIVEQDIGQPVIVIIDIHFQYSNNDIVSELVRLLGFLRQFYVLTDNVLIDLKVAGNLHTWTWEKALYMARQRTAFPVPVFITQTAGVEENYLRTNKSLEKFKRAVQSELMVSSEDLDDDAGDDDGCDYETVLKLALLHFAQSNDIDEQSLERVLQNHHSLEEVLMG